MWLSAAVIRCYSAKTNGTRTQTNAHAQVDIHKSFPISFCFRFEKGTKVMNGDRGMGGEHSRSCRDQPPPLFSREVWSHARFPHLAQPHPTRDTTSIGAAAPETRLAATATRRHVSCTPTATAPHAHHFLLLTSSLRCTACS